MTRQAYIRTDGDHRIGLGHVFRMRLLADEFARRGWRTVFCSRAGTDGFRVLAGAGYAVIPVADDWLPPLPGISAGGDVLIIDMLDTDGDALREVKRSTGVRVVTFDDLRGGPDAADLVINAVPATAEHPASKRARVLAGFDYLLLEPSAIERARSSRRPVGAVVDRLFLSFGGTDTHNITERMLAALARVGRRLSLHVNLGPGFERSGSFEGTLAACPHRLEVSFGVPSLLDAAVQADLVLCAGGMTLFEVAAAGLPVAAIAAELHETVNVAAVARHGAAVDLGYEKTLRPDAVAAVITDLLADMDRRTALADAGPRLIDGRGAARCADAIEAVVGR